MAWRTAKMQKQNARLMPGAVRLMAGVLRALLSVAVVWVVFFVLKKTIAVRLYPVCVSAVFLTVFGTTLLPHNIRGRGPMVFRLACLKDKSIANSPYRDKIFNYCRSVTAAWCVFFVVNGSVALWTALRGSDKVWSVYNGIVSYILMGAMFAVEYMIRRQVNAKMIQVHTITNFNAASRATDCVMCYADNYSTGEKKTWGDFLAETAKLRKAIENAPSPQDWVLHCDDYWYFICAFVALLQCKKRVLLTQNTKAQFLSEVRKAGDGFITDIADMKDALYIPDYLSSAPAPSKDEILSTPAIDADDTQILMFTSGSTGHAKAIHQRMTEAEADNAFVISKWGEDCVRRAFVSTVSAHHIYGFLFGISLPFALGVPFRRKRIEYPEEFESLTDREYMIIASPAFLKRTVEMKEAAPENERKIPLKAPFIFTSGGAVPFDVAEKTDSIMGSWPLEVYGSTETSGIAYRQSKNGMEWTPFDNAKVWCADDGCLVIVSPYIKDPNGFATSDLADMLPNGKFRLLGRADSIVKIEEKRISLNEVEQRILQTGLASDAKVIAMEGKRQYLAAAVVLNERGRARFDGKKRLEINRAFQTLLSRSLEGVVIPKRWRYLDALPSDTQGKVHKEDIQSLFSENLHSITDEAVTAKSEAGSVPQMVQLEFTIPKESDFFDGHFPEFHLLPAVAQFEVVTRFAKKYLGTQRYVPYIRRIKFSAPILPGTRCALKLEYTPSKGSIAYSLWDVKTSDMYSSGTFSALPLDMADARNNGDANVKSKPPQQSPAADSGKEMGAGGGVNCD